MSGTTVDAHKDELKGFDISRGTIRFQPDQLLPAALIRKLVKARIAENEKQAEKTPGKDYVHYHKDGSVWAKGRLVNDVPVGYWEWFRKDGTKLRSGHFEKGKQVGEWITYDRKGEKYKVTQVKAKKD
jgi:antitoxin component YwqK of YwqJK toxin-antitoxin module